MQEVGAVVVTGAAAGIGKATALRFSRAGWFVAALDVDVKGLETLEPQLTGSGARGRIARVDVSEPKAVEKAVDDVVAEAGALHAFVNNAGVLAHGSFCDVDAARLLKMVDINCKGVVNGARAALPHLRKTRGVLVSMSSASAVYGTPEIAVYAATKAFVSSLTEGLAIEESRRSDGARVVDILPSFVDTDMVRVEQRGSTLVQAMGVKLGPDDVAEAIFRAATAPGPVHKMLNPETRALKALVGISASMGPLLVKLVDKRR